MAGDSALNGDASSTASEGTAWQQKILAKQNAQLQKIPKDWLLPNFITTEYLKLPLELHPNNLMKIPRACGILSERELKITEDYTVEELLTALVSSSLTALEVTTAFSKRAAIAGQLTNCLTETYFEEARARAKYLDDLKSRGLSGGPLHGLPISLKESFQIAQSEATLGFVSRLGYVSKNNSALVDMLLKLGAVVYVKTNLPQTSMTADSHNNIFGRTLNPHNTLLTAGGSSGGEGALVAMRGSPLGVGTDIAGSIRIPALCCGTYGFRPTTNRIPYGGQVSSGPPGLNLFQACAGPLSNSIDSLGIFMRAILNERPSTYDSTALDVPWNPKTEKSPNMTRIGVLAEDPMYPLHPSTSRALKEAVKKLETEGFEIVQLSANDGKVAEGCEIGFRFFGAGPKGADPFASGEPKVPSVLKAMKAVANFIPKKLFPEIDSLDGVDRVAALNVRRHEMREHWRKVWRSYNIDAVIGPSAQHAAVPHDQYVLPPYTVFLNTLDYPACVMPYSACSKESDSEKMVAKAGQYCPDYDPGVQDGAPCSIQIFAPHMSDEYCLAIADQVDRCINPRKSRMS